MCGQASGRWFGYLHPSMSSSSCCCIPLQSGSIPLKGSRVKGQEAEMSLEVAELRRNKTRACHVFSFEVKVCVKRASRYLQNIQWVRRPALAALPLQTAALTRVCIPESAPQPPRKASPRLYKLWANYADQPHIDAFT